jgi:asparaginyl-tRNA synthetase
MSKTALVSHLGEYVDQEVSLQGWVNTFRSSGKIAFVEVRDGSGYVQAVLNLPQLDADSKRDFDNLSQESSISLEGKVSKHPKKEGVYELQATSLHLIHKALDYPIGKKEHGPDFLLQNRHLWLRSRTQWAIQRIRSTIIKATYDFFFAEDFIKIDSPIITAAACEGTTTLFEFDYYDLGKAYLSQSGQLYLEAAIAAHRRVFDFGPVFRAEKSKTRKHLSEFWMMDAEMAFCDQNANMDLQERLIMFIIEQVLKYNRQELEMTGRNIAALEKIKLPFPRITHTAAVKILRERGSEITEDTDLGASDETLLAELYDQPLFIERWPAKIKAFYMKRDPQDHNFVCCADLMAPEGYGELIGGSQREDDPELLLERMKEEKMPLEEFDWYMDTRRYGSVPHAGFGFGLERLVFWLAGVEHIRETIPFPRMLYRMRP